MPPYGSSRSKSVFIPLDLCGVVQSNIISGNHS
ncbi:hypothetical protein GcC1_199007 [Golovinomyces cichoracearum]|uniref:Uncharacterized protein n=1 Tax=Golovinomyces cichoracearum TaxID=62708 RepID=A0A420HFB4_9PEZI|nr:hypothetical protein GcC1_199007 [Golovinomyces cichoracearum]